MCIRHSHRQWRDGDRDRHNLDVIKCADWVIDLGPEGGQKGGRVVSAGPPEVIAQCEASYTARYLRGALA